MIKHILIFAYSFLFLYACTTNKENSSAHSFGIATPTIIDSLQAKGGEVKIPINWNYEKWEISIESSPKNNIPFIKNIYHRDNGFLNQAGQTNVIFTLEENNSDFSRSQCVTLKSITKGTLLRYTFTQAPRSGIHTRETILVDPSSVHQTIRGFGGTNLNNDWETYLTNREIDLAFGEKEGLNLSIMRLKIPYLEEQWENLLSSAKYASQYGMTIIATPWCPPLEMKNNHYKVGGHILPENYTAYAQWLLKFIDYMEQQGVNIDAISIQNEPDFKVNYESCEWTPAEELAFVKKCGSMIQTKTKLICAESYNFRQSYGAVLLNDLDACTQFDIVGGHIYGNGIAINSRALENKKEIWMTEHYLNDAWQNNCAITPWEESLAMAQAINQCMLVDWNAYIYFYIKRYYSFLGDGEFGTQENTILPRGYVMSHFSKFIRPGDVRIDATPVYAHIETSAYKNEHQYVIILINHSTKDIGTRIQLPCIGKSAEAFTSTETRHREAVKFELTDGSIKLRLAPQSISTVIIQK